MREESARQLADSPAKRRLHNVEVWTFPRLDADERPYGCISGRLGQKVACEEWFAVGAVVAQIEAQAAAIADSCGPPALRTCRKTVE